MVYSACTARGQDHKYFHDATGAEQYVWRMTKSNAQTSSQPLQSFGASHARERVSPAVNVPVTSTRAKIWSSATRVTACVTAMRKKLQQWHAAGQGSAEAGPRKPRQLVAHGWMESTGLFLLHSWLDHSKEAGLKSCAVQVPPSISVIMHLLDTVTFYACIGFVIHCALLINPL